MCVAHNKNNSFRCKLLIVWPHSSSLLWRLSCNHSLLVLGSQLNISYQIALLNFYKQNNYWKDYLKYKIWFYKINITCKTVKSIDNIGGSGWMEDSNLIWECICNKIAIIKTRNLTIRMNKRKLIDIKRKYLQTH